MSPSPSHPEREKCPHCLGHGTTTEGYVCQFCAGTGSVEDASPEKEAPSIQRYAVLRFTKDGETMPTPDEHGKMVRFTDHARLLSEKDAEIERLAKEKAAIYSELQEKCAVVQRVACEARDKEWASKIEALDKRTVQSLDGQAEGRYSFSDGELDLLREFHDDLRSLLDTPSTGKEKCPDCHRGKTRGGLCVNEFHMREDAPASPTLGAGGSESSEQTRWWFEDQWWVRETTRANPRKGEVWFGIDNKIRKANRDFTYRTSTTILRPAKSFKCDDGVERWETGEVAQLTVERKGTWFLDADGYPAKCETPTIFEHPILEPLPEAILPSPVEEGATIQRYEVDGFGDVLPNQRLGKYVKFTDHARLLSEKDAEIEEVKAQLRLIRAARNRALKGREEATDRANERWASRIEALAASYEEHGHWMNDRNRQITRTTGNALDPDGGREYLQIAKNIRAALSKEES